jgi:hypothetical protein
MTCYRLCDASTAKKPLRRVGCCCTVGGILLVIVAVIHCAKESPHFTREEYERIGAGMTLAQVEKVLGCPPTRLSQFQKQIDSLFVTRTATWQRGNTEILVYLNENRIQGKAIKGDERSWIPVWVRRWVSHLRSAFP